MVSGCYYSSILLLGFAVPHLSQNPFHQRHRLFLGMGQRGVHSEICEAAGWFSPSTFVRFYNLTNLAILWVNLTNIVQTSPSLGLFILYGRQVSTYGMTPRPQMALWLSLCLVYSVDSPGSYPHVSLGFESFHVITRPNTCSHTSLFDAIGVKYRNGMNSVTIITSVPWDMEGVLQSWQCYELHFSVTSFEEIWDAVSKRPLI